MVCGAAKPSAPCLLNAGSLVVVRLYLHPTARPTNYVGLWRTAFLQGWTPTTVRDVSAALAPDAQPAMLSVSGIVTSTTGPYEFKAEVMLPRNRPRAANDWCWKYR